MERQKAKQEARKKNTIDRIEQEIRDEKFLERQALHYLEKGTQGVVIDPEVIEKAPEELTAELKEEPVAFKPNSDVQIAFLSSSEDHVLFGGGRGSGKSQAFIADPLAYVENPNFKGLVIRRTIPDLRTLTGRAKTMYRQFSPGVQFKVKENLFVFPSGATIEYGYLDSESDLDRYHGQEYSWIGIDEISQLPEEMWVSKLLGSLRNTDKDLRVYFRATTNWTGVGIDWVKEYFHVDDALPNTTVREKKKLYIDGRPLETVVTKKWLNSRVFDNPVLANDPQYIAYLNSQPAHLRKAWLLGETTSIEGAAFPEFDREIHVCKPFHIPDNWKKFRGCDYGYADGAGCVWIALAPDGTTYVYREIVVNGRKATKKHTAIEFARMINDAEAAESVRYGVLDSSLWNKTGDNGPSLAEQMIRQGCLWRPADKSKGSRVAGKNKIHQMLMVDEKTGKPGLVFFENAMQCIKMMQGIPLDTKNAEDVDTDSPLDHQYDALRYVLMSRPTGLSGPASPRPPAPFNSSFGHF